jgi:Tfp pilus assembly protein PilX
VNAGIRRQAGATLVIALIVLAAMALLAVSTLSTTNMSLKVVGNMQSRGEALYAAQQAIETVISTPLFIANPEDAVLNPCGAANTLCTDLNGDGTPEYVTRLNPAPLCVSVKAVKESELNLSSAEDLSCSAGQAQQSGVAGVASGDSLCADTAWDITAEARSTFSGTKVTVTQGVAVRVSAADAEALCGANGAGMSSTGGAPPPQAAGKGHADGSQAMVKTGGIQRAESARSPIGAQDVRLLITQKRRRTYWFIHEDQ